MRIIKFSMALLLGAVLAGCAIGNQIEPEVAIRKDGGLSIERLEPGHSQAIRGNVRKTQEVQVAFVPLPNPMPREWQVELGSDRARVAVGADGRPTAFRRAVARALSVGSDGVMTVYDAVIAPSGQGYFVLLPPEVRLSGQLVIIDNSGRYLLTSQGVSVDTDESAGVKLSEGRIPPDFFITYPSAAPRTFVINRNTEAGNQFFQDLENLFSERIRVNGIVYSAMPSADQMYVRYTALNDPGDRGVSCGSVPVGTGGLIALGSGIITTSAEALSEGDCLGGDDIPDNHN